MIRKRENVTDYFNKNLTLAQKLETITEKRYPENVAREYSTIPPETMNDE